MKKPVVLCILDGCGVRKEKDGNAFSNAKKPTYDFLWNNYPHCKLEASGKKVGLPSGQMGNSEVGHTNIGCGRVIYQPLELINKSIEEKTLYKNEEILKVIKHVKKNNSKLHLFGLASDGGVHSHINHLLALLDMCKMNDVKNVCLHLCTDGRDVDPKSAYSFIKIIEKKLNDINIGKISTISGRYYAMDRDNNYDRLVKAYDAIVNGKGILKNNIEEYINENYKNNITDEFFVPAVFDNNSKVEDNDAFVTFNFRKDRIKQMMTALSNPEFNEMKVNQIDNLKVLTMFPVVASVKAPHAFDDLKLDNILGEYVSRKGKNQLRIAETEKFAHVTFFFDGGKEIDFPNEKKILINSPKVATYDLKPSMSAVEITDNLINELKKEYLDLVVINYANGDMVGHTGNYDAAVMAVECLDSCLKRVYEEVQKQDGTLIITADHGNCDIMWDKNKNVITSHTTSLVPLIITNSNYKLDENYVGKLADIAPTILKIMGLEIPKEMTGDCLVESTI